MSTIGYFAPLPPARTGVAEYAAALLQGLEQHLKIRVNRDGDLNLYQIGNNQLHREIHDRALRKPGVVLLHDAVLQHFYLGCLSKDRYIEEFAYNYGDWSRGLAARLYDERARSATAVEYFRYPMLKRIAESAKLVVVHNPGAAQMVREHAPAARVVEIPHLFVRPDPPKEGLRFEPNLFGVFGHLRESKRLTTVLKVLPRIPNARLMLAGGFVSQDLEKSLDLTGVTHLPYADDEAEFWRRAYATDVCINLRYPPAGETSGIAIRLMGIGKPVVMSAGKETDHFPDGTCVRIDTGLTEEAMLEEVLRWLANFPYDREAIGRNAARYIEAHHSLDRVSRQFADALLSA